jgi:glucose-1-phosphatase
VGTENVTFVLFDLGGVLVDVDQARAERAWREAGHAPHDFHAAIYESGAKPLGDLGELDAEGMRARVDAAVPGLVSLEALHAIWGAVVSWRPWVGEVVGRLTVPFGVLSTIDPIHQAALGPLAGAEPILYSCEIGAVKPDPRAFAEAVERCPVPPAQVRYVDDLPENVAAARSAGFDAHRVTNRAQLLEALDGLLGGHLQEASLRDDV